MGLTFDEFCRLPHSEQCVRYKELSSHDRFLARMNDYGATDGPKSDKPCVLSKEQQKRILEIFYGVDKTDE